MDEQVRVRDQAYPEDVAQALVRDPPGGRDVASAVVALLGPEKRAVVRFGAVLLERLEVV